MAAASASDDRRPPPSPGGAKVRRVDAPEPLFPAGHPYAEALAVQQKAPLAEDLAARAGRQRSPPRGDRRPLSTRNRSRERRAAAGDSNKESYQQLREKALK